MSYIRVLVVNNDHIFRAALTNFIHSHPFIDVIDRSENGAITADTVQDFEPDVILLSLLFSTNDGIRKIKKFTNNNPNCRVLILTDRVQADFINRALAAGVWGIVPAHADPKDLFKAICSVSEGEQYLHPTLSLSASQEGHTQSMESLTEREHEVLKLLTRGLSNRAIADHLHVSPRTVGNHVGSILNKLRLDNRTQAVIYAFKIGLVGVSFSLISMQLFPMIRL